MGCGARVRGAAELTPTCVMNFTDGAWVCSSEQTALVGPTVRAPPAIVRSLHFHREADPLSIESARRGPLGWCRRLSALAVTQQRACQIVRATVIVFFSSCGGKRRLRLGSGRSLSSSTTLRTPTSPQQLRSSFFPLEIGQRRFCKHSRSFRSHSRCAQSARCSGATSVIELAGKKPWA